MTLPNPKLLLITCLLPWCAWAQSSVFIEELTTLEVSTALRAGKTTLIIPVGGTEQNGPHMVMGKHNIRAKALSGKIATALGNALVAPVLAYTPEGNIDPPTEHMPFAGTLSIPEDAFKAVLRGAAQSYKKHGFTDIVLLGDSGNYQAALAAVATGLNRDWAKTATPSPAPSSTPSPTRAHFVADYYQATQTAYPAALRVKGLTEAEIGSHAGSADTALLMALDATMVKPALFAQAAQQGWKGGTRGDPRVANAALGQLGVDAVVKITTEAITKQIAAARR